MNVGLIGSGFAGNVHLEALSTHPAVSSILIAENDPLQIKKLSNTRYSASLVDDYRILLANPDIEVVDICLPHSDPAGNVVPSRNRVTASYPDKGSRSPAISGKRPASQPSDSPYPSR